MLVLNILYVLLAIAMVALILMQRGAGAQAGSGFGGGASGTVFGARGSANFLSKSTKWLAVAFFGLSLFMAWQATRATRTPAAETGGLMSELPAAPAGGAVPAAPVTGGAVPAAPAPTGGAVPAPATAPAVQPTTTQPAPQTTTAPQPAAPTGG
jgi:preprotein translocase subunit SecG